MTRGQHQIRVIVEIQSDGFKASIPSDWSDIPPHYPLDKAARFKLADCLASKALRDWNGTESKFPRHD
jgi:hypothetical protein